MAREEVKVPTEMITAAEKVLDLKVPANRAKDLFRYAHLTQAIKREKGNQAAAAKRLGITRSSLNEAIGLLEVRLA